MSGKERKGQIGKEDVERLTERIDAVRRELSRVIVGLGPVVEQVLTCLLCRGHALIEGVPGLGKTYLVRTLGEILSLSYARIQFTPDLMPADILGTNVLTRDENGVSSLRFQRGPLFTQVLLADEINRATPKTQSALLEAMQERGVTVGGDRYDLEAPFIVMATQNPIEMEGTYPLPEAQLDRFFYKIRVEYPTRDEMKEIVRRTTGAEDVSVDSRLTGDEVRDLQELVREVPVPEDVRDYAVDLVMATRPGRGDERIDRLVRYGSSPRGAQSLILGAKVAALLDGRFNVAYEDVRSAALPALRHRLILSFEGEAEGSRPEDVVLHLLDKVDRG